MAIMIFLFGSFFSMHQALALTSIEWGQSGSNIGVFSPFDGGVNTNVAVQFTVTDTDLAGNGVTDSINVLVNSTSDPTGITLALSENGDTGKFTNTNLVFSNGTGTYDISSSQTIGISKPSLNTDPNLIEVGNFDNAEIMQVFSSSDTNGIFMNLTETGPNTGVFTNTLHFTQGPSVDGSSIHVSPGDIVSIVYFFNGDYDNELVTPNPDPALGVIPAQFGDEVDVTYKDAKGTVFLFGGSEPGGGGGGLIRPGLVLDILKGVGGSPYIISPPSFGGGIYHYDDGLTLVQGNQTDVFDISKYNQELPRQIMVPGLNTSMTFKTYQGSNPNGVVHVGLFFIPRGQDMITTNSIASIQYDKYSPVEINDPNHILSNATASMNSDGKFQYTQFLFVPQKSYDKMSFLVRAWNDHGYQTDARVHDDINIQENLSELPSYIKAYNNIDDLQKQLDFDGYAKPNLLGHIHDTPSVFNNGPGKISWFYDTSDKTVTLVIKDDSDKVIAMHNELLAAKPTLPQNQNFLLGDKYYTHHSLSRLNNDELESTKSIEEIKALKLMTELYGRDYVVQYHFLGRD